MRVVFAGIFVFGGLLAAAALAGALGLFEALPPALLGAFLAVFMVGLAAMALVLFNRKGAHRLGLKSPDEHVRELEQAGLLASTDFEAVRAFGVEEFEDEGLHYFLELADGRVLFLTGQYLYDYEPATDDPALKQTRRFPCSQFTVRRHSQEGYVADIVCRGAVIEPELMAPPFSERDFRRGEVPEDGQVISDRPYDKIKARWTGAQAN